MRIVAPRGESMRERVAVIEDHGATRELLVELLTATGYEVEAIELTRDLEHVRARDELKLIITDSLGVPYVRAEAEQVVRDLRRLYSCPILVLSAHGQAKLDEQVLGADFVLAKPFSVDELVRTVRSLAKSPDRRSSPRVRTSPTPRERDTQRRIHFRRGE